MFDYIDKNMNTVLSNINVSFRDTVLRDCRVKRYIELEKSRIYTDECDYENGCGHEGWMEASFDVVVATLAFGVSFGYYNTGIG